jgi:hypothetical protein
MTSFRDLTVVIIETGRDAIRAGIGLHELLQRPTVVRLIPSPNSHASCLW